MAATNVFMNTTGVTFEHGATTIEFDEVEDVVHSAKGKKVEWSGDAAPGPMRKKLVENERTAEIKGANGYKLASIPKGTLGTLTWVEEDFYNGALVGSVTYVLTNFSFDEFGGGGKHNDVKKYDVKGSAVWTKDGSGVYVNPLTITQATV